MTTLTDTPPAGELLPMRHVDLLVPHRHLKITSLKEQSTSCGATVVATLRHGTVKIGTAENQGNGGHTEYEPAPGSTFTHADLTAFAAQCRDQQGGRVLAERVLDLLIDEYATERLITTATRRGKTVCRQMTPAGDGSHWASEHLDYSKTISTAEQRRQLTAILARQWPCHPGQFWQAWDPTQQQWITLTAA